MSNSPYHIIVGLKLTCTQVLIIRTNKPTDKVRLIKPVSQLVIYDFRIPKTKLIRFPQDTPKSEKVYVEVAPINLLMVL